MSYATKDQLKEIVEHIGDEIHLPQLVQHFDKSLIFSEDEKMVGQWINGKPIYQKTFVTTLPSTSSAGTEVGGNNISIGANVETIIDYQALSETSNGTVQPIVTIKLNSDPKHNQVIRIVFHPDNSDTANLKNTFALYNSWPNNNGAIVNVTIHYTKTTDSALDYILGTENDYSTNERIIGTWIDGKTLYQKTVKFDATVLASYSANTKTDNEYSYSDLGIPSSVNIIYWDGFFITPSNSNQKCKINTTYINNSGTVNWGSFIVNPNKFIFTTNIGDATLKLPVYVTLKYTK